MIDYRIPVYIQLKESIKEKIKNGIYPSGSQIPSERELAKLYGINRMTAKHAINALVEEGYLYRMHGSGTYVKKDPIGNGLVEVGEDSLLGLGSTIRYGGKTPVNQVIGLSVKTQDEALSKIFAETNETSFYELERLRYADEDPVSLQFAYLPYHLFMDADRIDFAQISLYDYMDMKGLMPVTFAKRLTMVPLFHKEADYLNIDNGTHVFLVEYFGYTADQQLVEYTKSYFRSDRTQFHFTTKVEE